MRGNKHGFWRILTIMLSVLLFTNSLGVTAIAAEFTAAPTGLEENNDVDYEIIVTDDDGITSWAGLQTALNGEGTVTLTQNITAGDGDSALTVPSGVSVTLDLNGNTLSRGLSSMSNGEENGCVIAVTGGSLTVDDSSGGGKITGGNNRGSGGGVSVSSGDFTLSGGSISGNCAYSGGGVYVAEDGCFALCGGEISGNRAEMNSGSAGPYYGGGVFLAGSGTIAGGSITGNMAMTNGSGLYVSIDESLTLASGEVISIQGNDNDDLYLPEGVTFSVEGSLADGSVINVKTEGHLSDGPIVIGHSGSRCSDIFSIGEADALILCQPGGTGYDLVAMTEEYAAGNHTHDYESPVWTWADDLQSASVTAVCAYCNDTETADAEVFLEETTATAEAALGSQTLTDTVDRPEQRLQLYRTGSYMNVPVYVDDEKVHMTTTWDSDNVQYDYNDTIRAGSLVELRYNTQDQDLMLSSCSIEYRNIDNESKTLALSEPVSFYMPKVKEGGIVYLYVDFQPVSYSITWNGPDNGAFDADGGLVSSAAAGQTISFNITPDENYGVYAYSYESGGETETVSVHNCEGIATEGSFSMPRGDVTVTADIRQTYSVAADSASEITCSQERAFAGDTVTGIVTPPEGRPLDRLYYSSNGADETDLTPGADGSFSFAMPEYDVTLFAEYISPWEALQRQIENAADNEETVITLDQDLMADPLDGPLSIPAGKIIVLDMAGFQINRNLTSSTDNGEAIRVYGILSLQNGTVTGGHNSGFGGGVTVEENARLSLLNVTVTGNTSATHGGGVYLCSGNSALSLSGDIVIRQNTGDNLYFSADSSAEVTDSLGNGSEIHVTTEGTPVLGSPITIASAPRDCASCFVSDRPSSDGSIFWDVVDHRVALRISSVNSWADLQAALSSVTLLPFDPDDHTYDESGSYTITLAEDITAGSSDTYLRYFDRYAVILDLNGHSINRNLNGPAGNGQVLSVEGGTLILRDSDGGGSITGGNNSGPGGGVYVQDARFIMEGGSITGNSTSAYGGGVYVYGDAAGFTMKGGSVNSNTAGLDGGGVYVYSGSLHVSGSPVVTGNRDGSAQASNVFIYISGGRVILDSALTEGAQLGISAERDIPLTRGYPAYNSGDSPGTYFIADSGYNLYRIGSGDDAGELAIEFGHTDSEAPEWTWAEDLSTASAAMYCAHCGEEQWAQAAEITGPAYDAAREKTCYTASVTHGDKTYSDQREVSPVLVERAEPDIDGQGVYIPGCEAHYELTVGDSTVWMTVEDNHPGTITAPEECFISHFNFDSDRIVKYTGPFTESGTTAIVLPAYYPEGTALTTLGDGSNVFLGSENAGRSVTIELNYPLTVASGAFTGCTDLTLRAAHASGLKEGEHNDETGSYIVEMTDAHSCSAGAAWAEDYASATLTITCACGAAHTIEAENVTITSTQDPDTHAFTFTASGEYDGESYSVTVENVTGFRVTVSAGEDGSGSVEFFVPQAQDKDYALFTPTREALEGEGLIIPPRGAQIRDLGEGCALDKTVQISVDTELTATWESTWALVQEALLHGGLILLYNDIEACSGESFLYVPADVTATVNMDNHVINRGLEQPATDGYVFRVDGTLNLLDGTVGGGFNDGNGGGLFINSSGKVNVYRVAVIWNIAENGGGVYVAWGGEFKAYGTAQEDEDYVPYGCWIAGNTATQVGGGLYLCGEAATGAAPAAAASEQESYTFTAPTPLYPVKGPVGGELCITDNKCSGDGGAGVHFGDSGSDELLFDIYMLHSMITDNYRPQTPNAVDLTPVDPAPGGSGNAPVVLLGGTGGLELPDDGWQDPWFDPVLTGQDPRPGDFIDSSDWLRTVYDNLGRPKKDGYFNNFFEFENFVFHDSRLRHQIKIGIDANNLALKKWLISGGIAAGALGLGIIITLIVDSTRKDDDDRQDKECSEHNWEYNSHEWNDDYTKVTEIRICSKCNKLDYSNTLTPTRTVDDSSKVTTYKVTMTGGTEDSKTVQPFKVTVKGGAVSGSKDILIAHDKGKGASYSMTGSPGDYDITVPDGYQFNEWDKTGVSFSDSAEEDAGETVTAKWKVRVRYANGGGTGSDPPETWVESGSSCRLEDNPYTREDYEFDGWKLDPGGDKAAGDSVTVEEPTTVTAKWKQTSYRLSFSAGGGSGTMDSIPVEVNGKIRLPGCSFTPAAGFEFDHWSVVIGEGDPEDKNPDDEIEMKANAVATAVWRKVNYTVSTEGITNGTVSVQGNPQAGETITLTVSPGTGYACKAGSLQAAWQNGENTEQLTLTRGTGENDNTYTFTMPAGNVTVSADFLPVYTVRFDLNGGSGSMENASVISGESYTLPSASTITAPKNKTFKEWTVKIGDAGAVGKQPDETIAVTADTTVTAVWEDAEGTQAVVNGVTGSFNDRIKLNYYFDIPETILADEAAYVTLTNKSTDPEKTVTLLVKDAEFVEGRGRRFSIELAAKEVSDTIAAKIFDGSGEAITVVGSSGKDYTETGVLYTMMQYFTWLETNGTESEKSVGAAAKDYCAVTQIYFNYNAEGLEVSSALDAVTADTLSSYIAVREGSLPEGVSIRGITAMLESDNTLRLYLGFKGIDPSDLEYMIDGKSAGLKTRSDGYCYLALSTGVYANHLQDIHSYSVSDGTRTYTIRASVLTYARSCAIKSKEAESNLGKALYLYNQAAAAAFGQ